MPEQAIVLFDGVCNLCAWSVQFIIRRDPDGYFKFAAIQSEMGRRLLLERGVSSEELDTLVLISGDQALTRSDAAIEIARRLSGLWKVGSWLGFVPRPIRDWVYNLIARNRYRWFGKQPTCLLPTRKHLARFIE
jgi:predicted DCC family thiol-disulfide oxidoreductase YuxK